MRILFFELFIIIYSEKDQIENRLISLGLELTSFRESLSTLENEFYANQGDDFQMAVNPSQESINLKILTSMVFGEMN